MDVDRTTSEELLENEQSGTFIIRPSSGQSRAIATLSVIQDGRTFHLAIRRRLDESLALGVEKANEKSFKDINTLINYYVSNYLILFSNGNTTHTLLLPYQKKKYETSLIKS